jgi:hypothetical protein
MEKVHPLHDLDPKLHKSKPVKFEYNRRRQAGERIPNEPAHKLEAWLQVLERIYTSKGASKKHQLAQPRVLERIKELFHRPFNEENEDEGGYITGIDDKSINSYLYRQAEIAQQQGHGTIADIMARVDDQVRAEARASIIQDQERSLDAWLDYLTSDDAFYPMWFKYYVFRNITKLAAYDKDRGEFPKRSKSTTAPFPDINREALAYVEDSLSKHYGLKDLDPNNPEGQINPELQALLDRKANFAKLYKQAIEMVTSKRAENLNITDGVWVKFEQTNDQAKAEELAKSLQGYNTGWCTAVEGTAARQLMAGDFYVYYTRAEDGQYSVPRIAIRMQNIHGKQHIAEVRGIETNQHMEAALVPIADAKMNEIDPEEAKRYKKASADMARLTEIYNLLEPIFDKETGRLIRFNNPRAELSQSQLRFLYEIDDRIVGFGYRADPRIEQILKQRDKKADLSKAFGVPPEQISLTQAEALSGNIVYHYGYLNLRNLTSAEGLKLPERVGDSLYLDNLTSAAGLELPKQVGGWLDLSRLTSAEGLKLPEEVGGNLILRGLTSAAGLELPKQVGGWLDLSRLTSAEGLKLPERVGGLNLGSLTSAEGLKLPERVGDLNLESLTSAEGLKLPEEVGGGLDLRNLISAEGLKLPKRVGGNLILSGLTSAAGLELPEEVGGNLYLNSLTSAEGLKLPEEVGGNLILRGLTSAEGLKLPERVGGNLKLGSLTSAAGLELPKEVGGDLNLFSLISAEGLKLPERVGGDLNLYSLTSAEGLELPERVGGYLNLESLTSAAGLELPEWVGGDLYLSSLTSAEGLELPERVGGDLHLSSLTSAEGLKLPEQIGGGLSLGSLTSAEGLELPEELGGDLYLESLPEEEKEKLRQRYPQYADRIFYRWW